MSRVQLALNVADLSESVAFYSAMFAVPPHKLRDGYANFVVADPPLKLVLFEMGPEQRGTGTESALNHLGVEVATTTEVQGAVGRLTSQGLATIEEQDTVCCHALQDKVWVHDPAGTPWEFYTITDDTPSELSVDSRATPQPEPQAAGCGCGCA
jgi:catechol 2,3-dioxygenase-like lactoylglutathione lyase family enzyme